MRKIYPILLLLPLILFSCSSGKKALQKGNYYDAITKAVERLKSNPTNSNALNVLKDGYPLAIQWSQEEIDLALSSNEAYKWEQTLNIMQQVNRLDKLIRSTPAARKIVPNPKSYGSELTMAYNKAAEERYNSGLYYLDLNTREDARRAYENFERADSFVPGYEEVREKLPIAKEMATLNVIVEAISVRTRNYKLSSEFFYDQVFQYLNNQFPQKGFVNFLSPQQAEDFDIQQPDFVVNMEFFDFSVGNLVRNEKEESLVRRVKVPVNDTTEVTKTYRAKLKTYTDEVISSGRLSYKVIDFQQNKLMRDDLIPGSFTWVNQYAIFVGDELALNDHQFALTQNKVLPLPPNQELFIEFTRPIYDQLTGDLYSFFRRYR